MVTSSRAPRAHPSQACEHCRSSKIRCLPSEESGVCQKCRKSGLSCVWTERQPRRGNAKQGSKARISALEAKVDELLARVADNSQPAEDSSNLYPSPDLSDSSHQRSAGALEASLDSDEERNFLNGFREMLLYFPFITIPAEASIASLSQERPMFLLAVLAAASSSDRAVQSRLEQKLRISILEKIMLEGAKSLDLLAALLVYISWYHFYYVPKGQQSSQLLHLAISMCFDLGLHLRPGEAISRKVGLQLDHYSKSRPSDDEEHDDFFSREARRLYLGCYYLSNNISWLSGKPNTLQYCDYMRECAASLGREREYPTDEGILPIIELAHMAETYHRSLLVARMTRHTATSITHVQAKVAEAQGRLQSFRSALPLVLQQSTFIELAYHNASFHIHEMDMINPFADKEQALFDDLDFKTQNNITDSCSFLIHSPRLEVLVRCLQGAKDFLDSFLTIPATEYCLLSAVQWYALIYATVIVYKLSAGLRSIPEWDVRVAREAAPLETYLETCCQRMEIAAASRNSTTDDEAGGNDLFSLMGPIWRNVKQTFERLKQLPQEESARDTEKVHETSFSGKSVISKDQNAQPSLPPKRFEHRCPAYPFWKHQPGPAREVDEANQMDINIDYQ